MQAPDVKQPGQQTSDLSYSSYLLDCSRKCLILGDAGKWSLYGNLEDSCLNNLGVGFKEGFVNATDNLKEQYEQLTKPIKIMIQALIAKFPILSKYGGVKLDGSNLREQAIKLYTLYSAFIDGRSDSAIATALTKQFEKVYSYNVPFRKTPPQLSMINNKIVIKFSYGSCNIFDAYEEVWKPLTNLKKILFPSQTDEMEENGKPTGLSEMKSGTVVPYPQQGYAALIRSFFPAGETTLKEIGFTGAAKSLKGLIDKVGDSDWTGKFSARIEDVAKVEEKGKNPGTYKNIANAIEGVVKSSADDPIKVKASDLDLDINTSDAESNPAFGSYAASGLRQILEKVDNPDDYNYKDGIFQIKGEGWLGGEGTATSKISITKKQDAADKTEKTNSLIDILASLVNFEQKTIGEALTSLQSDIKGRQSFYLGFPNVYFNTQKQIVDYCISTRASVQVLGVLISDASITFDYTNLDEAGYPMSGKLTINGVWNIDSPEKTFNLVGKSVNKEIVRASIPYTEVLDTDVIDEAARKLK